VKLKNYVNMHKSWDSYLEEDTVNEKAVSKSQQRFMGAVKGCQEDGDCPDGAIADTAASMKSSDVDDFAGTKHKGLPEKKKKVDEAGRYHRSSYKGEDPRAQAFDQAIAMLDDLVYDSLEDDVASYADDAVRAMSKAIEELEYKRNTVGNDPEADAAREAAKRKERMAETSPPINEAEFVGHHAEIDGKIYVDSNFLNSVRKIRDTFPSSLESMGFGEFYLQTPKGRIDFDRSRGQSVQGTIPSFVGRAHLLYAEPPELADELLAAMEAAGASEPDSGGVGGSDEEGYSKVSGTRPMEEAIKEGGMGDLHIEVQGALEEIMQEYGVRLEDLLGIIGDMKTDRMSSRDMMEGDGMKLTKEEFLKIVHEELQGEINKQAEEEAFYSADDLRNMVREEVGGLINDYKKSLEEADEGGPGVHDIFNMPEPQAPESTGDPKEDAIREIVASQSMGRVEGVKLDLYSASAIVKVLDALSPQNKEKYMQLPVDRMAQMAFKMMG